MGTIKLRRGTGSPAGSLAQYEVAMDVAAKKLYVSTNGTDAVVLANEYADSDAVSAIQSASSLTLTGSLTTQSGLTVDAQYNANPQISYGHTLTAKRAVDGAANSGDRTVATLWRDLDSDTINSGYDNRGTSLDYVLQSDSQGTTQYLGGISMQSGGTSSGDGHWVKAWSYDDGQTSFNNNTIFEGNKDDFYVYGKLRAQGDLVVAGISEFTDVVTVDAKLEAKNEIELHDSNSKISMDGADGFETYDTPAKFTATNFGNIAHLDREETSTGGSRISGYTQVNYVDSNRALINPGNNSGSQFAWGVNNSQFAQLGAVLTTASVNADNTIDYVNSASRIDFGVWTGDPAGTGNPTLTTALMIEPHQNQVTLNSINGGVTNFGTDGTGLSFQAPELLFHADNSAKDIQFEVDSNLKLTIEPTKIEASVPVQFPSYTTTQRNALTAVNGMMIYNSTTSKMQAYAGGAWVDLH